jgi:hypothetical protein
LAALFDGITIDGLKRADRKLSRGEYLRNYSEHGNDFARAVRAARREMLFEELGSNPKEWAFIDECLPAEEPQRVGSDVERVGLAQG